MKASYDLGIRVVLLTVVASAIAALFVPPPRPTRATNDMKGALPRLPDFHNMAERSGRPVHNRVLEDRVWIASFIFTRCKATCPQISAVMKSLQDRLADTSVRLVSFSVDPENDTTEVLGKYADSFGADKDRWWFVTADKAVAMQALIRDGFKLAADPLPPDDPQAAIMDISHSNKLVLLDRGNQIVGMFDSQEPAEIARLLEQARRLDRPWVSYLPLVNASLNGLATVLLVLALAAIRTRRLRLHIGLMVSALVVSALFLVSYLTYHAKIGGGVPFQGVGTIRLAYFTVLISHVILAAAVVPLVLVTAGRAIRKRYDAHARIARVTFPIWLYVSITGVVVYLMLYQMPVPRGVSVMLGGM